MIEDTEEIPDGEEMRIGETGMVRTEIGETEEEMTGTEETMLVAGFKAWLMVEQDQCRYLTCLTYHDPRTCQDRRRTVQGVKEVSIIRKQKRKEMELKAPLEVHFHLSELVGARLLDLLDSDHQDLSNHLALVDREDLGVHKMDLPLVGHRTFPV